MSGYSAAVVAAGAQARVHVRGYAEQPEVRVVAVADVDERLAGRVAAEWDIPRAYGDYRELLERERPELLSICAPSAVHRDVVELAVRCGVRAIHCEKPMADTYGDARFMHDFARANGVVLTINHQRRFDPLYRAVRREVAAGKIGEIVGIDGYGPNLFDWGSHLLDLMQFFLADLPAESVLGQVDVARRKHVFGALVETESVTHVHWPNGVNGCLVTGRERPRLGLFGNLGLVLHGRTGRIEIFDRVATLRLAERPTEVINAEVTEEYAGLVDVDPAIVRATALALADLVGSLETGAVPVLDSAHGLASAELVFATYESSARRGKVRLPLEITDNPLLRGIESHYWEPEGETFGKH